MYVGWANVPLGVDDAGELANYGAIARHEQRRNFDDAIMPIGIERGTTHLTSILPAGGTGRHSSPFQVRIDGGYVRLCAIGYACMRFAPGSPC
jgi:hypothetical protein